MVQSSAPFCALFAQGVFLNPIATCVNLVCMHAQRASVYICICVHRKPAPHSGVITSRHTARFLRAFWCVYVCVHGVRMCACKSETCASVLCVMQHLRLHHKILSTAELVRMSACVWEMCVCAHTHIHPILEDISHPLHGLCVCVCVCVCVYT